MSQGILLALDAMIRDSVDGLRVSWSEVLGRAKKRGLRRTNRGLTLRMGGG